MTPNIILHSIGCCEIQIGQTRLTPRASKIFSLALYLILERGKRIDKNKLLKLLWPRDRKTGNFRTAMHTLRSMGFPAPDMNDNVFIVPADAIQIDYEELLAYDEKKGLSDTFLFLDPRFLPDFNPSFSDEFSDWLDLKRRDVEHLIEGALAHSEKSSAANGVAKITDGVKRRMVGRVADMKIVGEFIQRVKMGEGGACLVWGEAGIGKSRLAVEAEKYARLKSVRTIKVNCQAGDQQMPLSLFVSLIPELFKKAPVGGRTASLDPHLKRIVEHDTNAVPSESTDAEVLQWKTRVAIFDLFDAVCYEEEPLLIVVEDIHWIDSQSARILNELMVRESNKHFGFLFTSRYTYEDSTKRTPPACLLVHQLKGLDEAKSYDLIFDVLAELKTTLSNDYIEKAVKQCTGNPYFLEELINHYVCTSNDSSTPHTIQGVLRERLSKVSPSALQLLQAATFLGKHSTLERLSNVLDYKTHEMLIVISELNSADMIVGAKESYTSDTLVMAKHDLLALGAVEKLPELAKRMLHQRVAEVLEKEVGEQTSALVLWDCTEHWTNAGNLGKASKLALGYATHLMAIGFPQNAANALEKAFYYCTNYYDKLIILESLAKAQLSCSRWTHLGETLMAARLLKARLYPESSVHDELELMSFDKIFSGEYHRHFAIPGLKNCIIDTEASPNHKMAAGVLLIKTLMHMGEINEVRKAFQSLSPLFESPKIPTIKKLEIAMIYHHCAGDIEIGSRISDIVAQKSRKIPDPLYAHRLMTNSSACARQVGSHDVAISRQLEAINIIAKISSSYAAVVYSLVFRTYLEVNDIENAEIALNKAIDLLRQAEESDAINVCSVDTIDIQFAKLRLAVYKNDVNTIVNISHISNSIDISKISGYHLKDYVAGLLFVELYTNKSPVVISTYVSILEPLCVKFREMFIFDFENWALVKGLHFLDEIQKADLVLLNYAEHRRTSWPIRNPLALELTQARARQAKLSHDSS